MTEYQTVLEALKEANWVIERTYGVENIFAINHTRKKGLMCYFDRYGELTDYTYQNFGFAPSHITKMSPTLAAGNGDSLVNSLLSRIDLPSREIKAIAEINAQLIALSDKLSNATARHLVDTAIDNLNRARAALFS